MDFLRPHINGWVGEVKTQLSQEIFMDSKVSTHELIYSETRGGT